MKGCARLTPAALLRPRIPKLNVAGSTRYPAPPVTSGIPTELVTPSRSAEAPSGGSGNNRVTNSADLPTGARGGGAPAVAAQLRGLWRDWRGLKAHQRVHLAVQVRPGRGACSVRAWSELTGRTMLRDRLADRTLRGCCPVRAALDRPGIAL